MKGLPVGMFQPGDSFIHNLHAAVKIAALLLMLTAVINTSTVPGYAVMIAFTALLIRLSRMKYAYALAAVLRLSWFFIVILFMNLCFYAPDDPWVCFWIFRPSYEGLMQGINVVMRVAMMLVLSNILTLTTAPIEMTGAIAWLLSPLRIIKVPTGQVAMILSVAVQFIPTLLEETEQIRKAQTARGARFDSRKLAEKAKAVMPLAIPVFVAAFKRADELSLAMESRGYRADSRTFSPERIRLDRNDISALLACCALCAIYILT